MTSLVIGTRGSKLARAQADLVCRRIARWIHISDVEIKIIQQPATASWMLALLKIGDKALVREGTRIVAIERRDRPCGAQRKGPDDTVAGLD